MWRKTVCNDWFINKRNAKVVSDEQNTCLFLLFLKGWINPNHFIGVSSRLSLTQVQISRSKKQNSELRPSNTDNIFVQLVSKRILRYKLRLFVARINTSKGSKISCCRKQTLFVLFATWKFVAHRRVSTENNTFQLAMQLFRTTSWKKKLPVLLGAFEINAQWKDNTKQGDFIAQVSSNVWQHSKKLSLSDAPHLSDP